MIVSSYGRGLWEVNFLYFPFELYCEGDCTPWTLFDPTPIQESIDWHDMDVFVFVGGVVNGLILSQKEVKTVTVAPGTVYKRYPGNTKDHRELNIVQSENGAGFSGLKGCLTAIENGEVIKALILKQNSVIGFISGKYEFSQFS